MKNLTNDTKKEVKNEPRNIKLENLKNAIISIGGTVIFTVLAILFPLFRVLGGFLTYSGFDPMFGSMKRVFYWDRITSIGRWGMIHISNYIEFSKYESAASTELIW